MDERTKAIISAAVVIIANAASFYGISVNQEVWVNGICAIVMLVSTIWGIWKNHNFTFAAQQGQLVTDEIKQKEREAAQKEE